MKLIKHKLADTVSRELCNSMDDYKATD